MIGRQIDRRRSITCDLLAGSGARAMPRMAKARMVRRQAHLPLCHRHQPQQHQQQQQQPHRPVITAQQPALRRQRHRPQRVRQLLRSRTRQLLPLPPAPTPTARHIRPLILDLPAPLPLAPAALPGIGLATPHIWCRRASRRRIKATRWPFCLADA